MAKKKPSKKIGKVSRTTSPPPIPQSGTTKRKRDGLTPGDPWGFPRGSGPGGNSPAIGRVPTFSVETIAEALANNNGIKKYAAEQLGCTYQTLQGYIDRYPRVWNAYLEAREKMLDVAEHNFFKIVERPKHPSHFAALRFFLETVGRGRGYNSRIEFDMRAGEHTIGGELDLDKLTLEQAKQFRDLLQLATVSGPPGAEDADFEIITEND